MGKIAESYKSEYEIALTRQNSLEASLANVVSQSQTTGQARIQLRELESNAETSRALYDNFLQRYMEAAIRSDQRSAVNQSRDAAAGQERAEIVDRLARDSGEWNISEFHDRPSRRHASFQLLGHGTDFDGPRHAN